MAPYDTSLQHILAELERIDLLVQVQVWRARQLNEADEQFQGLVITEQEVDALLAAPAKAAVREPVHLSVSWG